MLSSSLPTIDNSKTKKNHVENILINQNEGISYPIYKNGNGNGNKTRKTVPINFSPTLNNNQKKWTKYKKSPEYNINTVKIKARNAAENAANSAKKSANNANFNIKQAELKERQKATGSVGLFDDDAEW